MHIKIHCVRRLKAKAEPLPNILQLSDSYTCGEKHSSQPKEIVQLKAELKVSLPQKASALKASVWIGESTNMMNAGGPIKEKKPSRRGPIEEKKQARRSDRKIKTPAKFNDYVKI